MKKLIALTMAAALLTSAMPIFAETADATPEPTPDCEIPPDGFSVYWDGSIEITPPEKTVYYEGEYLDLTGLEVYGTSGVIYSDGRSEVTHREKLDVTADIEGKPLTADDKYVTVTGRYSLMESELTGQFEITVLSDVSTPDPLTVFRSDTLIVGTAPINGHSYNAGPDGKYTVVVSGQYIKPTEPPVTETGFYYGSGILTIKSPQAITDKKLVAAVYDWDMYSDLAEWQARLVKVKTYDINTVEVPKTDRGGGYYRADVDVSEDLSFDYVRFMLLDSLENPRPIIDAEDIGIVWTGLRQGPYISILTPRGNGIYSYVAHEELFIDSGDNFTRSFELEPGEYKIDINSGYGDIYSADFTVLTEAVDTE